MFKNEIKVYRQKMEENTLQCKQTFYDIYATLVESRGLEQAYDNIMSHTRAGEEFEKDRSKLIEELELQIKHNQKLRK